MSMTLAEPTTLSYLARRSVAAQWRTFLRGLVETLDSHLDAASRDSLLRAVGARMAGLAPVPQCGSLAELEARVNDILATMDWGYLELALDPNERVLVLTHCAAPTITTAADPSGGWIAAVLEGMYGQWLASQPGAEPSVQPLRVAGTPAAITLRYGRVAG